MLAGVAVQVCAQDIAMLIGARAISECVPSYLSHCNCSAAFAGPLRPVRSVPDADSNRHLQSASACASRPMPVSPACNSVSVSTWDGPLTCRHDSTPPHHGAGISNSGTNLDHFSLFVCANHSLRHLLAAGSIDQVRGFPRMHSSDNLPDCSLLVILAACTTRAGTLALLPRPGQCTARSSILPTRCGRGGA